MVSFFRQFSFYSVGRKKKKKRKYYVNDEKQQQQQQQQQQKQKKKKKKKSNKIYIEMWSKRIFYSTIFWIKTTAATDQPTTEKQTSTQTLYIYVYMSIVFFANTNPLLPFTRIVPQCTAPTSVLPSNLRAQISSTLFQCLFRLTVSINTTAKNCYTVYASS